MESPRKESLAASMKEDFGIDLPLGNGRGQSRCDPVEVVTKDATQAYFAEIKYVQTLFEIQKVHWRYLKTNRLTGEGNKPLHQTQFEVKFPEGANIVTETRNFYFDVSQVHFDVPGRPQKKCQVPYPFNAGMPEHLAWMHFQAITNNEAEEPGMGSTLNYQSPSSYMGVYIYDKQLGGVLANPTDELLSAEMEDAAKNVADLNPHITEISRDECEGVKLRIYRNGDSRSLLGVTVALSCFVKFRITIPEGNDRFHVETAYQSMIALLKAVKQIELQ